MSFALIGIVLVQIIWLRISIQNLEVQFSRDVHNTLNLVSKSTEDNELYNFYVKYSNLAKDAKLATQADIQSIIYEQIDTTKNEKFTYARTILEQKYKLPTDLLNEDSLTFKRTFSKRDIIKTKHYVTDKDLKETPVEEKQSRFEELTDLDKDYLKDLYYTNSAKIPIYLRVKPEVLRQKLQFQFEKIGIQTPFQFAVYNNGHITPVKSDFFNLKNHKTYQVPLFVGSNQQSNYSLYVNFPEKTNYIFKGIIRNLILSVFFILVIIGVFATTLIQLKKQKQISEIKTDFINNMTHEFKTPIATINLALDAIKNPKVIGDQERIVNYVNMIRDENKRMHNQVENVLRISRLNRNQIEMEKDTLDFNQIIENAVSHVKLLVENRQGKLVTDLVAQNTKIFGDYFHLTNVMVNILDNAIKYSPETLEISIKTLNNEKELHIFVTDKGMGMSKHTLKHVFDEFYREETGNIHNVKGHGLGLSYVKKIVEMHQGKVFVESEKGKGSTFTLKFNNL